VETKPGIKTSEAIALVAGCIAAIIPVIADRVPPDSVWAVLVGILGAVSAYILGRSYVKGKNSTGTALVEASKASVANPSQPPQG
jgi:hypothetical protein